MLHWEKVNENCIFAYVPEIEPVFGVFSLLEGESVHRLCSEIYGEEQVANWKRRYRFLFETYDAIKEISPLVFFDIILDVFDKDVTAESFKDYLLSLPEDERIYRQVEWEYICGAKKKDIKKSLTDDVALESLYSQVEDKCPSFLAFSMFIRQNDRFIEEFFSLTKALDSSALSKVLKAHQKDMELFKANLINNLERSDGLGCSQQLMGKTFHNRGPYDTFYFMPSLLLPYRCSRFFYYKQKRHNPQLLINSIREKVKGKDYTIAALKALGDETRYQILMLLAKDGSIKGQDIARTLKLAPSTVSHHMNELKAQGLITEEPIKTAKYYGISWNVVREVLETIEKDFKLKE